MHFVLVDHYYRQRYFKAQQELARQVAMTRKGNVLVIDVKGSRPFYLRPLLDLRNAQDKGLIDFDGVIMKKMTTDSNVFYLLDINDNLTIKDPISRALKNHELKIAHVHTAPLSLNEEWTKRPLYLDSRGLKNLQRLEKRFFNNLEQIFMPSQDG
jgi:hypothetical protein